MAQKQSVSYQQTSLGQDSVAAAARPRPSPNKSELDYKTDVSQTTPSLTVSDNHSEESSLASATAATNTNRCFFCGNNKHPRLQCPARDAACMNCKKKGHFARVCKSKTTSEKDKISMKNSHSASVSDFTLASVVGAAPSCLKKTICTSKVNNMSATVLIDTGSSDSFVKEDLAINNQWTVLPDEGEVSMASTSLSSKVLGYCNVSLELLGGILH